MSENLSSKPQGESDARTERFVALLSQHQTRLSHFLETLVPGFQAAQDLLQDTNLVLWRKRLEFEEGSNFWAWACSIAHYEVLHYRRSQQRSKLVFGDTFVERLADVSERRRKSMAIAPRRCEFA